MEKIITKSSQGTKEKAKELIRKLLENKRNKALVIGLEGELGSGKTTFVQGMAEELGIKESVTSPTFVIFKKYSIKYNSIKYFYHIDCYRLNSEKDMLDLDFKEMINNKDNLIIIEWAEKIKNILPKGSLRLKFHHLTENEREILIYEKNNHS